MLVGEDIERLTGKKRPSAQRRALDKMGVAYLVRPDGRPVVLEVPGKPARRQPDFSAVADS
jgi:hypothetical protein